jgi:ribonuclease E
MTVIDVNTGKFTGSGGNLEETVTKNNLEAAEEIVRQLRTRDIGGIIVIDFIDMVLESNRDLVLRRLVECLGRDRTKHQVAEVTSLGLVQMTRKRIGTGLLESFSEPCEVCKGRGHIVHLDPADTGGAQQQNGSPGAPSQSEESGGGRRSRRRRGRGGGSSGSNGASEHEHDHDQDHESDDSGPESGSDFAEVDATADAVEVADGAESGKAVEPGTSVEPVVSANGAASDDLYDEPPTPREDEDNASISEALEPSVEPVDTTAGLHEEVASAPSAAAFSASGPGRRRRRH